MAARSGGSSSGGGCGGLIAVLIVIGMIVGAAISLAAVVDPFGRVVASLGLDQAGYIDAVLPAPLPATPYVRFGDAPALIAIAVVLGLTFLKFASGVFRKFHR